MEKEVDPDVIKATQNSLGKYVKRPPLSEKLLKKPPFRFLHDIVTTVLKTTGFFNGLFDENELVSENVKDRESKIAFLTKVITVLGTATGNSIAAKPSKIVAGQEADKTNELLQCLALALEKQLSSDDAVKKYKEGVKGQGDAKTADKETVRSTKKSEAKKLTSKSNEKLTTTNKKDTREKSLSRPEKDRTNASKTKPKEINPTKKDSPPKKSTTQQGKTLTKKNSIDKVAQNDKETVVNKNKKNTVVNKALLNEEINDISITETTNEINREKIDDIDSQTQPLTPRDQDDEGKLNASFTIAENDLNSSLSSQDLMEVSNGEDQQHEINQDINTDISQNNTSASQNNTHAPQNNTHAPQNNAHAPQNNTKALQKQNHDSKNESDNTQKREIRKSRSIDENSSRPHSFTRETDKVNPMDTSPKTDKTENTVRPKSVRPSSSRPGAPRLREKHDNIVTGNENLLVGKVNIIVENTPNEEDEDASIVIVEEQNDTASIAQNQQDLQSSSNEHGALVQQILDSQKEYSQMAGKTEIEWQFGAQKAREAVNQEIEQLRYNIQALSRVANPLGKVLDHIQEDVEVMRQELQQWTKTYEEASKELLKQKTANEDSLIPLHTKLKVLDADIKEKHDKINDLKIVIHKNSSRIEKLLAGGDVQ